jgi:SAM-dependent methyltransferase
MTPPKPAGEGAGAPLARDAPSTRSHAETGPAAPPPSTAEPSTPELSAPQPSYAPIAHAGAGDPDELACAAAAALADHVADRAAPLAEFGCGNGMGGAALARAGFTTIDGFDLSDENLAAAGRAGVYRRLARADPAALGDIGPGTYANAAAIGALDPERTPAQALDALLRLLPPGGCLAFTLPGAGASVGPFRARVIELCEHFVAEPVFRGPVGRTPGQHPPGRDLQTTLFVLKKR